jgi:hypothetical protein
MRVLGVVSSAVAGLCLFGAIACSKADSNGPVGGLVGSPTVETVTEPVNESETTGMRV